MIDIILLALKYTQNDGVTIQQGHAHDTAIIMYNSEYI